MTTDREKGFVPVYEDVVKNTIAILGSSAMVFSREKGAEHIAEELRCQASILSHILHRYEEDQVVKRRLDAGDWRCVSLTTGNGDVFRGYTIGETWNGWECPYFPLSIAVKVMEYHYPQWERRGDDLIGHVDDCGNPLRKGDPIDPESYDIWEKKTIDIQGDTVDVWPIGAFCWVWDEVTHGGEGR